MLNSSPAPADARACVPSSLAADAPTGLVERLRTAIEPGARAMVLAGSAGAALGLAFGGAYLLGAAGPERQAEARAERLGEAAKQGFSEAALQAELRGLQPGAAATLRRLDDPQLVADTQDWRAREAGVFDPISRRLRAALTAKAEAAERRDALTPATPFQLAGGARTSPSEFDCLSQAVYYEARGESAAGQAAVAQVVLNRVRHPAFPKSICAVVFQGARSYGLQQASYRSGCQFSFACDGSMRRGREGAAWTRAQGVARRALDGYVMADVGRSTHFHTTAVSPGWGGRLLRTTQVGLHVFYRFGRGGSLLRYAPSEPRGALQVAQGERAHGLIPAVMQPDADVGEVLGAPLRIASAVLAGPAHAAETPATLHAPTPPPVAATPAAPIGQAVAHPTATASTPHSPAAAPAVKATAPAAAPVPAQPALTAAAFKSPTSPAPQPASAS